MLVCRIEILLLRHSSELHTLQQGKERWQLKWTDSCAMPKPAQSAGPYRLKKNGSHLKELQKQLDEAREGAAQSAVIAAAQQQHLRQLGEQCAASEAAMAASKQASRPCAFLRCSPQPTD